MNHHYKRKTFAIIGAGPKGIAAAVKAKVLQEFGFHVDQIILIEKHDIAANWTGEFGYTNGEMKLGTSPEKDVVFPVTTNVGDAGLNRRIQQRLMHFTWDAFLIQTGRYADWMDRGKLTPSHKLWALYLQWVAKQLAPQVTVIQAEVIQIDLTSDNKLWELTLKHPTQKIQMVQAHRLMITGPGKTQIDFIDNESILPSSTYDLESFWHALKHQIISKLGKLAIIGSGEHAASALLALSQYAPQLEIDVISPKGYIASRAESYYENRMYSQPDTHCWSTLTVADRMNFIQRTDLDVFSQQAISILNDETRHRIIPGRVINLKQEDKSLSITISYNQEILTKSYDEIILATGFDQVALLKSLLTPKAQYALMSAIDAPINQQAIAHRVGTDLAIMGMKPQLHLPMLAGLMQGPGFANLSCLGLLADRVVTAFAVRQSHHSTQAIIPFYRRQESDKSNSLCR